MSWVINYCRVQLFSREMTPRIQLNVLIFPISMSTALWKITKCYTFSKLAGAIKRHVIFPKSASWSRCVNCDAQCFLWSKFEESYSPSSLRVPYCVFVKGSPLWGCGSYPLCPMQSHFCIPGQEQHQLKQIKRSWLTQIQLVSASSQKVLAQDSISSTFSPPEVMNMSLLPIISITLTSKQVMRILKLTR